MKPRAVACRAAAPHCCPAGPARARRSFALRFLVHGAQSCKERESSSLSRRAPDRIVANAAGFGWDLMSLQRKKTLCVLDAQPSADFLQSGEFDLAGMLAVLGAQAKRIGARRIVLDALDIVLALLPDDAAKRREVYRLHHWLLACGLTGLITAKAGEQPLGFMHFMVDCSVVLNHRVVLGVSQRNLRVQKYRGSSFDENESPFVIGKNGFEVAIARTLGRVDAGVSANA
jgi:circadian clock protein KaiC